MTWRNEDDDDDESLADDPDDPDESDTDDSDDPALVPCPFCRKSISEDAEICPHCRNYISREDASIRTSWRPIWIIVAAVLALAAVATWYLT